MVREQLAFTEQLALDGMLAASILIVDDDTALIEEMQDALTYYGFECSVSTCVRNAMALVEEHCFDVLITDYNLHPSNGGDLVEHVRALGASSPKIVMISGFPEAAERLRNQGLEVDAFLRKPVKVREFVQTLRAMT